MSNQVVKVKRETIAECMKCPLCDKLLRDATTISECLHTFCQKCIYKKLSDEEFECCPICNIDLGCVPLEKLRPDHSLQDVRAKIFPFKRRKVKAPEVASSVTLLVRRRERSLSSLVVSTPRVSTQNAMTGRSKAIARKASALRDHSLQDVRAKIFPFKRRKLKAPEVVSSVTLPVRRKERSLSSLVVSTPRVSTQTAMTGRRSKAIARKASALRGSNFPIEKSVKKEEDSECPESFSSPETLNKFTQNIRQNSFNAETSSRPEPEKETANGAEIWGGKADLWKPLNCLVEVANRSKSSKHMSFGAAKPEPLHGPASGHFLKTKIKENGAKSRVQDKKDSTNPLSADSVKPKKLRRIRPKKQAALEELSVSPQAVIDAASAEGKSRIGPIWFSLVASEDQESRSPLPQISASYLRIKDGNMSVSFVQKYLMRKLALTSENEVEIRCMGQSVLPTLKLYNLVDLWLQTTSTSQRVPASIGSSAKDFVMVLCYARKIPAS